MQRSARRASRRDAGVDVDATTLADMEVRTAASRQLTRHAAALVDAGERVTLDASIAKLYSTDTCVAVAQAAVDLCAPGVRCRRPPRGGAISRREGVSDLRGHQPDPARRYRASRAQRLTRRVAGLVASDAWTFASTKSRPRSATRFATSHARRSRHALPRSIAPASSRGTSSISIRKHDLFALPFPPEYGGLSGSALTLNVAIEEIAKVCATSALILTVQALGGYALMIAGTDEQKARLLPDLASGAKLSAYALSEPGAGSDPAGMETRAERHGDEYVITGSKIWITAGGIADTITVFAKTDPDAACQGRECVRARGRAAPQGLHREHDPRQARHSRQQHRGAALRRGGRSRPRIASARKATASGSR